MELVNILHWAKAGGFVMLPLGVFSLVVWAIILERIWRYRKLKEELKSFHLEALNALLKKEPASLKSLCERNPGLPLAQVVLTALERSQSKDERVRVRWVEGFKRKRSLVVQDLKRNLWILGTIANASPFVGLFGTVIGILLSFQTIAQTGKGGFDAVASGISEALIATAAGIVVAVISSLAFNAFQVKWAELGLLIKIQSDEIAELLSDTL